MESIPSVTGTKRQAHVARFGRYRIFQLSIDSPRTSRGEKTVPSQFPSSGLAGHPLFDGEWSQPSDGEGMKTKKTAARLGAVARSGLQGRELDES